MTDDPARTADERDSAGEDAGTADDRDSVANRPATADDPDPTTNGPTSATDDLVWETRESVVDYTCPGFDVRLDRVTFPDGTEGEFHSVAEPASVVVLPFTGEDDLVVVDEWRQAVGRVSRGLPAGGTEPDDDDLAATARRELAEETGYAAETVEPLVAVEPLNGLADAVHHYFVARGCRPTAERDLDHNESIRVETTTLPDLRDAVLAGEIRDGRTVLGVLYYDRVRTN